jgi:hypothetical protein
MGAKFPCKKACGLKTQGLEGTWIIPPTLPFIKEIQEATKFEIITVST